MEYNNDYECNYNCNCSKSINKNLYGQWPYVPYYNETSLPIGIDPKAGSWPLYYFKRGLNKEFYNLNGKLVNLTIENPQNVDFYKELNEVIEVQKCLIDHCNQKKVDIALFWGTGVPVSQWTPIAIELINGYKVPPPNAGRIMSVLQGAINDAFVMCWYYKYLYNIPRPCQLYHDLKTILNTPRFPTYPSGHSVVSGACVEILSYYFPNEIITLNKLAEEASTSRLYGGIHFKSDLEQGLNLGRRIGKYIVEYLKSEEDCEGTKVDSIYYNCAKIYNILPPYYNCK